MEEIHSECSTLSATRADRKKENCEMIGRSCPQGRESVGSLDWSARNRVRIEMICAFCLTFRFLRVESTRQEKVVESIGSESCFMKSEIIHVQE
jgi:hypothetical protein